MDILSLPQILHIEITWDHIRKGQRGRPTLCPAALAVNDCSEVAETLSTLDTPDGPAGLVVAVGIELIGIQVVCKDAYQAPALIAYFLPDAAIYFIKRFDSNRCTTPSGLKFDANFKHLILPTSLCPLPEPEIEPARKALKTFLSSTAKGSDD